MKKNIQIILSCAMSIMILTSCNKDKSYKISCIGDSITFGWTLDNPQKESYPALLDSAYRQSGRTNITVQGFGVCGATLGHSCDMPYIKEQAYQDALASAPDLVTIMLGTNDSKPQNRIFKAEFTQDLDNMVKAFSSLESKPKIVLMTPPHAFSQGWAINDSVLECDIRPIIREYARNNSISIINLDQEFTDNPEMFSDGIHPNKAGQELICCSISKTLLEYLKEKKD